MSHRRSSSSAGPRRTSSHYELGLDPSNESVARALSKAAVRTRFREILASFGARRDALNRSLCEQLKAALAPKRGVWAAFRSLPEEPDVFSTLPEIAGLQWAFPVVKGADLEFRIPLTLSDSSFARGSWGLCEPSAEGSRTVEPASIDGFLVPGLAFDRTGGRLGRGKGFYDRCLQDTDGFRLGVAFDAQIADDPLPVEAHDVRMHALVTETRLIWTGERRL